MSYDSKGARYCDECGRTITKAHRRHLGSDYCSSCYPRVFVRRPCRLCGNLARFHQNTPVAKLVCGSCERQRRVCLRCGTPLPRAAKLVDGGAVCGACAPHFAECRLCPWCGRRSFRLSSAPTLGITEKICDRCRNKLTHRTCSVCHRYRPVAGELPDGRPYCAACTPDTPMTHRCPGCDKEVPGPGGGRCLTCLNRERVAQEIGLQRLTLTKTWGRDLYEGFGFWLLATHPEHRRLLILLRTHYHFFEKLDVAFDSLPEITEHGLLDSFQVAGLRAHALPVRYLAEIHAVSIGDQAKADHVERCRVTQLLEKSRSEAWGPLLGRYANWLKSRGTAIRTSRLYISTAVKFCRAQLGTRSGPHSETMLHDFLKKNRGLRANLYPWNTFCNETHGTTILMPAVKPKRGNPKTVGDLERLLARIEEHGVERAPVSLLQRALAKTFGFTAQQFGAMYWAISRADGYAQLSCGQEHLRVPEKIEFVALEWVKRRSREPRSALAVQQDPSG